MAYFIAACVLDFQRALALVILTSFGVVVVTYELVKEYKGESIVQCFRPAVRCFKSNLRWIKWWVDVMFLSCAPSGNLLMSEYVVFCLYCVLQDFHFSSRGPARVVARVRHEASSWAADIVRRGVHVCLAYFPLVSTQDGGESTIQVLALASSPTQVICALFCWDFGYLWPCASVILRFSTSASLQQHYLLSWRLPHTLIVKLSSQVTWRPVFWGLGMQFCIGLFVIRTQPGLVAFEWLGNQVKVPHLNGLFWWSR